MFEHYSSDDVAGDDHETVDIIVPSGQRLPLKFNGLDFALTPENTKLRLFDDDQAEYARAQIDVGDGTTVDAPLDAGLLQFLYRSGFPTVRPERPDASDEAYMQACADRLINEVEQELKTN